MKSALKKIEKNNKVAVVIGIDRKDRSEVSTALSGFLASTYMLYLKTLSYHWNVVGPNFVGLHNLFQVQYNELHAAGDDLAERVRALGCFTPGTVKDLINSSQVKDDSSLPQSPEQMITNLLKANEICSKQAREVRDMADEAEDEVTVDMMVGRMTAHDKAAWMLRSLLQ